MGHSCGGVVASYGDNNIDGNTQRQHRTVESAHIQIAMSMLPRIFPERGASAMTRIAFVLTLLSAVLGCLLPAAPAQAAGAPRTFVSAAGSDSNNCTNVATPCRHIAAAYAATAPNGEIYVLDPANYGSLTITGPVSIEGHGWASIAPPSGSAAITINANPGDKINIIGVVLDGTALATTTGIQFNSGGSLTVRDSVIRNFAHDGIIFQPNDFEPEPAFCVEHAGFR